MELAYEYNEYVVGYVVTDKETNRSVNFQFNPFDGYNFDRGVVLKWGCDGDSTHESFEVAELEKITDYLLSQEDVKELISIVDDVMSDYDLRQKYEALHAEQGYIWEADFSDILNNE